MNEQIKIWLDSEMNAMQEEIQKLNKRLMKKVPLWMAISIAVMVGIGLLAGYDFLYILKVHFLIGCVIAFFIWLGFFLQIKTTSIKKVRKIYEKAIEEIDKKEINSFEKQMKDSKYEAITFENPTTDRYPARILVGEDFWVYYRYPNCTIIKASEVNKIYERRDTTNISYNVGGRNVRQNVSLGMSLVISCKNNEEKIISFGNEEQVKQAKELIKKYAGENSELFS